VTDGPARQVIDGGLPGGGIARISLGVRRGWTPGRFSGRRSGQRGLRPTGVGHRPRAMPSLRRARRGVASPPHRWGGDLRCGTRPPRWGGIPHFVGVRRCLTRRPTGPAITPSPVDGVRSRDSRCPGSHTGDRPQRCVAVRGRVGLPGVPPGGRGSASPLQDGAMHRWSGTSAPRWGGIPLHRGLAVPDPPARQGRQIDAKGCGGVSTIAAGAVGSECPRLKPRAQSASPLKGAVRRTGARVDRLGAGAVGVSRLQPAWGLSPAVHGRAIVERAALLIGAACRARRVGHAESPRRPARRARQRLAPTRWAKPFASGTSAPRWGGIPLHRGLAVPDPPARQGRQRHSWPVSQCHRAITAGQGVPCVSRTCGAAGEAAPRPYRDRAPCSPVGESCAAGRCHRPRLVGVRRCLTRRSGRAGTRDRLAGSSSQALDRHGLFCHDGFSRAATVRPRCGSRLGRPGRCDRRVAPRGTGVGVGGRGVGVGRTGAAQPVIARARSRLARRARRCIGTVLSVGDRSRMLQFRREASHRQVRGPGGRASREEWRSGACSPRQ
jgi:hypothetical protein